MLLAIQTWKAWDIAEDGETRVYTLTVETIKNRTVVGASSTVVAIEI